MENQPTHHKFPIDMKILISLIIFKVQLNILDNIYEKLQMQLGFIWSSK